MWRRLGDLLTERGGDWERPARVRMTWQGLLGYGRVCEGMEAEVKVKILG